MWVGHAEGALLAAIALDQPQVCAAPRRPPRDSGNVAGGHGTEEEVTPMRKSPIREVEGDILKSRAALVAHGVAPNDDFHSGLALALRERWPGMYKDFRHFCHDRHPKEGDCWIWGGPGGARIAALFTQGAAYGHGARPGKATVENVGHALRALRKELDSGEYDSVALPKLATGVGGLNWDDVRPLIDRWLGDLEIPVIVYSTYHPGERAEEGLPERAANVAAPSAS